MAVWHWESAMAIEVALDIAPGNQAAIPEKAAEVAPEVRNVRDGSGNRPAMQSPLPEGSLGG